MSSVAGMPWTQLQFTGNSVPEGRRGCVCVGDSQQSPITASTETFAFLPSLSLSTELFVASINSSPLYDPNAYTRA